MNNQIIVRGNLAKRVEIKSGEKQEYALFTVATNRGKNVEPDFLDFFCFEKHSIEWMRDHNVGHPVFAEGYVSKYKDKDGMFKTRLVATFARPFERIVKEESKEEGERIDDPETEEV